MTTSTYEIDMPHWPQPLWSEPPGTSLERMNCLLEALGNPQEKLPPVVHVAGTNGKGSTIAMLRSILEAAGLKVHSYTSPHIEKFSERIRLGGEPIEENYLYRLLEQCRLVNEEQPITFFEGTTAAAFLAFSENPADMLLLETGIGGSEDATNVVTPRLSIITSVSYDHMEVLGDSLELIADHKAGIMKPDVPVIISFQEPEVAEQLEKTAEKIGAPAVVYGKHWAVQKSHDGFIYADAHGQIEFPMPALAGPHQLINAGNAIAALSVLEEFELSAEQVAAGLRWVKWPGRLEHISKGHLAESLPQGWELWFDGGHNVAAGYMLSVQAQEQWQDKPLYVVYGATRGKPVGPMLLPLEEQVAGFYVVPVAAEPQCYTPQEIADQADDAGLRVQIADSVMEAIEDIKMMEEGEARIIIFGSLFHRLELIA